MNKKNDKLMKSSKIKSEWMLIKQTISLMLRRPAQLALCVIRHRINIYNRAYDFCTGRGIEIGALSIPYTFRNAKVQYADVSGSDEMRATLDAIPIQGLYSSKLVEPSIILRAPRFDLPLFSDGSVDFVYSSHALEHTPNPIFAIGEYIRVVREGGSVYSVIPNKEQTYDVARTTTSVDELVRKYRQGIFEHTFEEALDVVLNTVNHPLYAGKEHNYAEQILHENAGIHHFYTFDPKSTIDIIYFCNFEFGSRLTYFCAESSNIHFCLQKGTRKDLR